MPREFEGKPSKFSNRVIPQGRPRMPKYGHDSWELPCVRFQRPYKLVKIQLSHGISERRIYLGGANNYRLEHRLAGKFAVIYVKNVNIFGLMTQRIIEIANNSNGDCR